MAKTNRLAGIIDFVSDVVSVGEKNTAKQDIVILVPGYVDRYGEKKGKDEYWQVSLFNDQIDKYNLYPHHIGKKVNFELYVRSTRYENREGRIMYIVNNSFASFEFAGEGHRSTHTSRAAQATQGGNDYHQVVEPLDSEPNIDEPPF